MTKKLFMFIFLNVLNLSIAKASTPPNQWLIDMNQGNGTVEFSATGHPSALKIVGKGAVPHGAFKINGNKLTGMVSFDLTTLDTGISLRDKHMKEKYLEVEKYHDAKLTITEMLFPQGTSVDQAHSDAIPFSGKLMLHGVERPVSGTAKIETNGGKITIAANFGLKVSDYQILIPTFAGITMTDEVTILVNESAPLSQVK